MLKFKARKYTEQQLRIAVKTSYSIRECLKKLCIAYHGGNYKVFHKNVKLLKIDTSHFTGQLWNKGQCFGPKRPIEDYLSNKYSIGTHSLKKRLINEKIFKTRCQNCNKSKWMKQNIPLELHHKDGNSKNNNLSNLELLCPNCHAQTDNYRGKNKKVERKGLEPLRS